jgi:GT2 family glycosyltransferase
MKDLSIIIVSWNVRSLLRNCLLSIQENLDQTADDSVEVVVVDNASQDDTVELLRADFPWVRLIENDANRGFAQANNLGIRNSCGKHILLLNPDTELCAGALPSLVRFMEGHTSCGAAGAYLLNPDHTLQKSCFPFPTLFREFWFLFHLDWLYNLAAYPMESWPTDAPHAVDVVKGAALMVRRDVVERIGLLDESYFMYTEEVDWCRRIKDAGWEIYWAPMARVIHYGGQSTRLEADQMFIELYRSKLQYFRKHSGTWAGNVYKLILLAAALSRVIGIPPAILLRPDSKAEQTALAGRYRRLIYALPRLEAN